jgi:hypothetical protein
MYWLFGTVQANSGRSPRALAAEAMFNGEGRTRSVRMLALRWGVPRLSHPHSFVNGDVTCTEPGPRP